MTYKSLILYFLEFKKLLSSIITQSKTYFSKADEFPAQKPRQINNSSLILYFHLTQMSGEKKCGTSKKSVVSPDDVSLIGTFYI